MGASDGGPAFTMDEIESAYEAEIVRVSHLEYDSHEVCEYFFQQLRTRLIAARETK